MELVNEFSVQAQLATAWPKLSDVPTVASCIPGARIEERDDTAYRGRVEVKAGPVKLGLVGSAIVLEQDDDKHLLVVRGTAKDSAGQGTATVTITMRAHEAVPGSTQVTVTTQLELGGRVAQFGQPLVSQISKRIVQQFVDQLDALLDSGPQPPAPAPRRTVPQPNPQLLRSGALALAGLAAGFALGRSLSAQACASSAKA